MKATWLHRLNAVLLCKGILSWYCFSRCFSVASRLSFRYSVMVSWEPNWWDNIVNAYHECKIFKLSQWSNVTAGKQRSGNLFSLPDTPVFKGKSVAAYMAWASVLSCYCVICLPLSLQLESKPEKQAYLCLGFFPMDDIEITIASLWGTDLLITRFLSFLNLYHHHKVDNRGCNPGREQAYISVSSTRILVHQQTVWAPGPAVTSTVLGSIDCTIFSVPVFKGQVDFCC